MPTRIEMLKQAGFSDAEIGDWATAERQRMHEAGFGDDEIDQEFGVTRPPQEPPAAFIERLKQGNAASRIAGAAGDYAQRYFGDEPLGFSPRNQAFLRRLGIGGIAIPAAKPVDAALRAVPAGIAAAGAAVGQALEEAEDAAFGPGPQASGKAARDFAALAQIAAMLSGAGRPAAVRMPAAVLPRAEDFRNAAAAISGRSASFRTEQKLLRLWTEHGIPPAEAAHDAMRDRALAADLASDSGDLPDVYTGAGRKTAAAGGEPGTASASSAPPAQVDAAPASPESRPGAIGAQDAPPAARTGAEPAMAAEGRDIAMYTPPKIWQRPFAWDYRRPPRTGPNGWLLTDIDGRPLNARFVAGRRFAGKGDQPLSPAEIREALDRLDIQVFEVPEVPAGDSPVGLYHGYQSKAGPSGDVYVKSTLTPMDQSITLAHEFGHALDHYAGILSKRLTLTEVEELRKIYPTMRAGPRKTPHPQPEDFHYSGKEINRELVAEGFRAYLTNPNYFKMKAPRTAARFREAVNESPYLKHVVQLNSLGAAGVIGAGLASGDRGEE